jgi:endonuclease YncB( thermonuclease family)
MLIVTCDPQAADSTKKASTKWVSLTNCLFMSEKASDGDSFYVKFGPRELLFRLYFVDAPETDESVKERIRQQCEYFGVTREELLKAGEDAKKFTAAWLKKSFIVRTRWDDAQGRSRVQRHYALIDVGGQDLAEMLLSRGWARAKGKIAILPDGTKAGDHMKKLEKLEAEAKTKRIGIWAASKFAGK